MQRVEIEILSNPHDTKNIRKVSKVLGRIRNVRWRNEIRKTHEIFHVLSNYAFIAAKMWEVEFSCFSLELNFKLFVRIKA